MLHMKYLFYSSKWQGIDENQDIFFVYLRPHQLQVCLTLIISKNDMLVWGIKQKIMNGISQNDKVAWNETKNEEKYIFMSQ